MAATTATRSTRRLDGLHHPHLYNPLHHQPVSQQQPQQQSHSVLQGVAPGQRNIKQQQQQQPNMAMKRHLPPLDRDIDTIKRKKHFVVEIPSKPASHRLQNHNSHHQTVASSQVMSRPPEPAPQPTTQPPPPPPSPVAKATTAPTTATTATPPPPLSPQATVKNPNKPQNLTKHKEKVANGLKHELDRLQPSEAVTKDQGRKLRSQEATRFKSELSAYFPDYDEVIGNDPKEHHLLNIDTPIVIADSRLPPPPSIPLPAAAQSSTSASNISPPGPHPLPLDSYPIRSYGDHLFTDLCDSQRIDFDFLKAQYKGKSTEDPLTDAVYEGPHKKAERLERSIRNLERGRAQHEKDQVIRLLDSLQGPDWLKVMGVSGITEGKKKSFEPARAHFIKGCQAILNKFRRWTAEEKRRKQEKDQREREAKALRDSQEQESEEEEEEEEEEEAEADEEVASEPEDEELEDDDGAADESDGEPPDSIDVDASVAKQLREEALAASKTNARSRAKARARDKQNQNHKQRSASAQPPPAVAPEPLREFKSFFKKPYQRAAALGKNRRRGRTVLAWGHPVPEPAEREFELPDDLLGEETLRAQARRKRKERRGKH
ncbi:something about silencing, SAS, complex subunit 4-domain-containing protein [Coniochaeta sp. 2T2.1]|nr:something about silencing, SAS, complex subunit 4-domain-containing protein [Coniochaeta sp. 2T2.1]